METKQAQETQYNPNDYSDALTQFTQTWQDDEGLEALLNFVAPKIPVTRRFEYKQTDQDQMFYSETDDLRASGSTFKRIQFSGSVVQAKTLNKGLSIRVDAEDVVGNDWQERYVHLLMKRLYRNELRRAILALKQHAKSVDITWKETSSPDVDIRGALILAGKDHGFAPNRLLFGELAWYARQDCYAAQNNAGARISAEMSREHLAEKLLVEDIKLLKKQMLGLQGKELIGNEIFAFYAQNGLLKDEISNIKRFVTPCEDRHLFRVYVEEHAKFTDITVEHYSNIVITSNTNILQLNVQHT